MPTRYAPDTLIRADEWLSQARCVGMDPEIWFHRDSQAEARRICRRCPVRKACLALAIAIESKPGNFAPHGVFGGLTARQRTALK